MANKYLDLNPQKISEMDEREKRRAYSELRSIARKRADRLEAAGFEAQRFNPVNQVDKDDLDYELAEVAYYLNSPGSSVKIAKKEREQATMAARGYHISDYSKFGKFMDSMRYRYRNRKMPDSGIFADIYQQAERRRMSEATINREFGKYLRDEEDAMKLRDALASAPMKTKGRNRLTAKNLKAVLNDLYSGRNADEDDT